MNPCSVLNFVFFWWCVWEVDAGQPTVEVVIGTKVTRGHVLHCRTGYSGYRKNSDRVIKISSSDQVRADIIIPENLDTRLKGK